MKYSVRVCNCGRIHAIPKEKINGAIAKDKSIILVCRGCGSVTVIGADSHPGGFYDQYEYPLNDSFSISPKMVTPSGSKIAEILFDKGIKVPMMTGEYATSYSAHGFTDFNCPAGLGDSYINMKEYLQKRDIVNMKRLISENKENPELLKAIAANHIEGLNWEDTYLADATDFFR